MLTLSPIAPAVKPAPLPTARERAVADRLAFLADGGDPDEYRSGWAGDRPYEPSVADLWGNRGYELGAAGELAEPSAAFPGASERDVVRGTFAFTEGMHEGFREFAERVGFDMGLAGKPCERPDSIPGRYALPFELGWSRGDAEADERARILEDYFQELDWEHAQEQEQREWDAINREAGG